MQPFEIIEAINASEELTTLRDQGNYQRIAEILSQGRVKIASRFTSARGVLEKYPYGPVAADAVLTKLETFAATAHPLSSLVRRANSFMSQPDGLDLGSPATVGMLAALTGANVITPEERDGLLSIATFPNPIGYQAVVAAILGA